MAKYVDLSERVSATFYSDEYEEWTQQTVTIADVLDSVCDDYTVLPSAQTEHFKPCKNCVHLGHAYMAPCKNCRRNQMMPDWYTEETE